MKIAIAGGTGVVGSYAADAAEAAGHDVVVLTRHSGVDVVIDTLNLFSLKGSVAKKFFATTARNLQEAGHRAGVRHIVTLSIVAVDRVPGYPYYAAKLAQEEATSRGPV
ncbi:MAG: NAD-dependent epimerase/dehydratase family protein, partial [Frankiaceae bacterium]|nr:NAD-dependent epimerase/dehydratase family protein [Frankiaceae bacterium]